MKLYRPRFSGQEKTKGRANQDKGALRGLTAVTA